jgi:hypothetical protein
MVILIGNEFLSHFAQTLNLSPSSQGVWQACFDLAYFDIFLMLVSRQNFAGVKGGVDGPRPHPNGWGDAQTSYRWGSYTRKEISPAK